MSGASACPARASAPPGPPRRELLDDAGEFTDLAAAQAAVDRFLHEYNTNRPHQALNMAFPADRFRPNTTTDGAALLPLKLPSILGMSTPTSPQPPMSAAVTPTQRHTGACPGHPDRPGVGVARTVCRWCDGVRPGCAAVGEPAGRWETVLTRYGPLRHHRDVLGRHRCHPYADRWHPAQVRAFPPVRQRPGNAAAQRWPTGRAAAAHGAQRRPRRSGRGRPDRQRRRPRLPEPACGAGSRDPRRAPGEHPHRRRP
ncbi:integrase core domain-containing protein [Dactylosporangium fulvum]|uniref:integrase core domain-containing protein n=1 Tax=Dactylosporangium fulvum TaxID=53359 RepID=UPI0038732603